jgi:transcriptional regulator with PAS, ATPase and Fis domain
MARIGVITDSTDIVGFAQEISFETGHELLVKLGVPNDNASKKALLLQNEYRVDAIIARCSIYDKIYDKVDIPVFRIDHSNFELAKAFHQAFQLGAKVLFVEVKRIAKTYDLDMITSSFGYKVDVISMDGLDDVPATLDAIAKKGYDAVVSGGHCIISQLPEHIHGIELSTKKSDLFNSLTLALQAIEVTNKKKEKIRWLDTVVDNVEEGIMTCDKSGIVETFNTAAVEIIGIAAKDILGHNIGNLCNNPIINAVYEDGQQTENKIVSLNTGKIIINRIPILVGLEQRGLVIKIQKVTKIQELEQTIRKELLFKGFVAKATFDSIAGNSMAMQHLKATAKKYATSSSNILIYGESGTGKELFAQSIHNSSPWHNGPFVAVNCAALSESLLESELFGYEEGAFTGAKKGGKQGLFELAHGGTIFLDEIGDMPRALQSRLLRIIQEKEVIRLGGSRMIPVNNRIICATNKNLAQEVENGSFREDLYYRINILRLHIPPVRERPEDIAAMAMAIVHKKSQEIKKKIKVNPSDLEILKEYHWPGNTREIEAFVERLLSVAEGLTIEQNDIVKCMKDIRSAAGTPPANPASYLTDGKLLVDLRTMDEMEVDIIAQVNDYVNGNKDKLEKILGMSKTTLWRKMKHPACRPIQAR